MNKIYLSALALMASATISAQVLNPSFEDWTGGEPDNWSTFNGASAVSDVTDGSTNIIDPATEEMMGATNGNSFVTLTTFNIANTTDATNFPNGDYGSVIRQTVLGVEQYEDFSVDVKFDLQPNDSAIVYIQAVDGGGNLTGLGFELFGGTQANFSTVTIPMQYVGSVAGHVISIASSEGQLFTTVLSTLTTGSTISVDNIVPGTVLPAADGASNIVASDISDNGDGSDLEVVFDAAANESTVSEYRIIAIETGLILTDYSVLPATAYTSVTPDGSANYTEVLGQAATYIASDGAGGATVETIVENVEMDIYVYSVADGTNAVLNTVAGPSNPIMLTSPLSVKEQYKEVSIYPNPANNFVNFDIDGLENGTITISSVTGQEVVNTEISNGAKKIDISNLNNGVYIYNVRNQNGEVVATNKLVVRK